MVEPYTRACNSSGPMLIFDLLALVEAHGGKVDSRVRIQKEAYLLQWAGLPIFQDAKFKLQTQGPSSRELADALHEAVNAGYLSEMTARNPENTDIIITHHYELTSKAKQEHSSFQETSDSSKKYISRLNTAPRDVLALTATALFLQKDCKSSCISPISQRRPRGVMPLWNQAVAMIPEAAAFLGIAKKLVDDLILLSFIHARHKRPSRARPPGTWSGLPGQCQPVTSMRISPPPSLTTLHSPHMSSTHPPAPLEHCPIQMLSYYINPIIPAWPKFDRLRDVSNPMPGQSPLEDRLVVPFMHRFVEGQREKGTVEQNVLTPEQRDVASSAWSAELRAKISEQKQRDAAAAQWALWSPEEQQGCDL